MTPTTLVTIHHIHVARGEKTILRDLSLSLHAKEAIFVVGENGVGKSTLLRSIARLCPLQKGSIQHSHNFAWLGHQNALKPSLTLRENLMLFSNSTLQNLTETLDSLALIDLLHTPIRHLSAGQQRRAAFARIVISRFPIWLLDEPTTNMDPVHRTRIEQHITRHCHQGGGAIITSHVPLHLKTKTTYFSLP